MSKFLTDLFDSIFTPGPTPSLIVATNASFACLQAILLVLLIATYSIHFLVLSLLSAGLWFAINWFVTELQTAQVAEGGLKGATSDLRPGDGSNIEAETALEPIPEAKNSGSKEIEVVDNPGELKPRGSPFGSKSELSTEDEWEKVSEDDKDK